jgi:hypothetical protein
VSGPIDVELQVGRQLRVGWVGCTKRCARAVPRGLQVSVLEATSAATPVRASATAIDHSPCMHSARVVNATDRRV